MENNITGTNIITGTKACQWIWKAFGYGEDTKPSQSYSTLCNSLKGLSVAQKGHGKSTRYFYEEEAVHNFIRNRLYKEILDNPNKYKNKYVHIDNPDTLFLELGRYPWKYPNNAYKDHDKDVPEKDKFQLEVID